MVSWTADYSDMSEETKHRSALQDILFYIGFEKFFDLSVEIAAIPEADKERTVFVMSFAGVRGFPCEAWWQLTHGNPHKIKMGKDEYGHPSFNSR